MLQNSQLSSVYLRLSKVFHLKTLPFTFNKVIKPFNMFYYLILFLLQFIMTGVAVLKVDDLGRRPLLIGGVGGLVCDLLPSL